MYYTQYYQELQKRDQELFRTKTSGIKITNNATYAAPIFFHDGFHDCSCVSTTLEV